MKYRKPMKRSESKREFRNRASHTHVKNVRSAPMRGGIRL